MGSDTSDKKNTAKMRNNLRLNFFQWLGIGGNGEQRQNGRVTRHDKKKNDGGSK